ncbi:hypothetical protein TWF481_011936 [Arthrobotrys musiformis]|uniref:Uncharacterized protein n=1 Tax=Arthrobotrys musiformis TaxID=47236 RepID=A0AAV9VXZ7_9PEZI
MRYLKLPGRTWLPLLLLCIPQSLGAPGDTIPAKTAASLTKTLDRPTPIITPILEEKWKDIEKPNRVKRDRVKVVTVVRSVPVTATVLKRSLEGGYPGAEEDLDGMDVDSDPNGDPMDTDPPKRKKENGDPMEIDPDSSSDDPMIVDPPKKKPKGDLMDIDPSDGDFTTVSILAKVVRTDKPVVITSYACNALPTDLPKLAKAFIEMKPPGRVSCFSPENEGITADLASQDVMSYIKSTFCATVLKESSDVSGVAHVVTEQAGVNWKISATWVMADMKPSKKACVDGMQLIWDKCVDSKDGEGATGGKALLVEGVFYSVETLVGGKAKAKAKAKGKGKAARV